VLLRPLTRAERSLLRSKLRQTSLSARLYRRYRAIALVRQSRSVLAASRRADWSNQNLYRWVSRFNASGFAAFERPSNPRGRIPIVTGRQLRELCDTALTAPGSLGLPFTSWSVRTLAAYCRKKRLIPELSDEWVRVLLRRSGLSSQRIRTWKTSRDPAFGPKGAASAPSAQPARRARRS